MAGGASAGSARPPCQRMSPVVASIVHRFCLSATVNQIVLPTISGGPLTDSTSSGFDHTCLSLQSGAGGSWSRKTDWWPTTYSDFVSGDQAGWPFSFGAIFFFHQVPALIL